MIGIDLGISSVRVVALDPTGAVLTVHGHEYPIHQPAPGFAEQSPGDWWNAACTCLRRVTTTFCPARPRRFPPEVKGYYLRHISAETGRRTWTP